MSTEQYSSLPLWYWRDFIVSRKKRKKKEKVQTRKWLFGDVGFFFTHRIVVLLTLQLLLIIAFFTSYYIVSFTSLSSFFLFLFWLIIEWLLQKKLVKKSGSRNYNTVEGLKDILFKMNTMSLHELIKKEELGHWTLHITLHQYKHYAWQ